MFIYSIFLLCHLINAADTQSTIEVIPVDHIEKSHDGITFHNVPLAECKNSHIETFSRDITVSFIYGQESKRVINHRKYGELPINPYESTSRMKAFDQEKMYFVTPDHLALYSCAYGTNTIKELKKFKTEISRIKLSKLYENRLYLFINHKSFINAKDDTQPKKLVIFNTRTGIKETVTLLSLVRSQHWAGNLRLIETKNSQQNILYCRYGGENNCWLFNVDLGVLNNAFLPYTYVNTIKITKDGSHVAIGHNDTISICSSDAIEKPLYQFDMTSWLTNTMYFIPDSPYLMVANNVGYKSNIMKQKLSTFNTSLTKEFKESFIQFGGRTDLAPVPEQPHECAVHIVNLASKEIIYTKFMNLQYGYRTIKQCFEDNGILKTDEVALHDGGCYDGQWHRVSFPALVR
jgi:hypothetical protein